MRRGDRPSPAGRHRDRSRAPIRKHRRAPVAVRPWPAAGHTAPLRHDHRAKMGLAAVQDGTAPADSPSLFTPGEATKLASWIRLPSPIEKFLRSAEGFSLPLDTPHPDEPATRRRMPRPPRRQHGSVDRWHGTCLLYRTPGKNTGNTQHTSSFFRRASGPAPFFAGLPCRPFSFPADQYGSARACPRVSLISYPPPSSLAACLAGAHSGPRVRWLVQESHARGHSSSSHSFSASCYSHHPFSRPNQERPSAS